LGKGVEVGEGGEGWGGGLRGALSLRTSDVAFVQQMCIVGLIPINDRNLVEMLIVGLIPINDMYLVEMRIVGYIVYWN